MDTQTPARSACVAPADVKLSIIMPVRNEGVNIAIMLRILSAAVRVPHETLFVHDRADDDSVPAVRELQPEFPNARLVLNERGPGVANAILAGVGAARGEYLLIFAVDEVGPVLAVDKMLTLMDEGADLVSCTRYALGGRRLGGSLSGRLLSRCANWLFRWLVRSPLTDATTGIKMFRRSIFDRITLEARPVGWAVAFELAIKAQLAGLKLAEVPIVSIDRLYGGKSSFSLRPWVFEYLRWFVWGWRELRKTRAGQAAAAKAPGRAHQGKPTEEAKPEAVARAA